MQSIEIWCIVSSIVSVILAILAILLSVYFFIIGRKSEKEVSNSLIKIEAQADMLQRVTGKQLDRLTKHITKKSAIEEWLPNLVSVLEKLPYAVPNTAQQYDDQEKEQLLETLVSCYIALYFYITQTNYWSQHFLPRVSDFDESDNSHGTIKRIIDMSNADFDAIVDILGRLDPARIEASPIIDLLNETRDIWKDGVRSSTQVFDMLD